MSQLGLRGDANYDFNEPEHDELQNLQYRLHSYPVLMLHVQLVRCKFAKALDVVFVNAGALWN